MPISIHDSEVSEVLSELSDDYYPGMRMLAHDGDLGIILANGEPVERITVNHLSQRSELGHIATYRRTQDVAATLAEAIELADAANDW